MPGRFTNQTAPQEECGAVWVYAFLLVCLCLMTESCNKLRGNSVLLRPTHKLAMHVVRGGPPVACRRSFQRRPELIDFSQDRGSLVACQLSTCDRLVEPTLHTAAARLLTLPGRLVCRAWGIRRSVGARRSARMRSSIRTTRGRGRPNHCQTSYTKQTG